MRPERENDYRVTITRQAERFFRTNRREIKFEPPPCKIYTDEEIRDLEITMFGESPTRRYEWGLR